MNKITLSICWQVSEAIAFTIVRRENGLQHVKKVLQEGESDVKRAAAFLIKNLSRYPDLHPDIGNFSSSELEWSLFPTFSSKVFILEDVLLLKSRRCCLMWWKCSRTTTPAPSSPPRWRPRCATPWLTWVRGTRSTSEPPSTWEPCTRSSASAPKTTGQSGKDKHQLVWCHDGC